MGALLRCTLKDCYFCQTCGQPVTIEGKHTGDCKNCAECARKIREEAVSIPCISCQQSVIVFPSSAQGAPRRCSQCANVVREKYRKGELEIPQLAISNGANMINVPTSTNQTNQLVQGSSFTHAKEKLEERLLMHLNNIEATYENGAH